MRRRFTAFKPLGKQLDRSPAHLLGIGADGGQRRLDISRHLDIVEADNRHLLRYLHPVIMQGAQGADGKRITGSEAGGRPLRTCQQLVHHPVSVGAAPAASADQSGIVAALLLHHPHEMMGPAFAAVAPADKSNLAVAQGKQVTECLIHCLAEMRPHRVIVGAFLILVNEHYSVGIVMQSFNLFEIEAADNDKTVAGPEQVLRCPSAQCLSEPDAELLTAQLDSAADRAVIRVIPFFLGRTPEQQRNGFAAQLGIPFQLFQPGRLILKLLRYRKIRVLVSSLTARVKSLFNTRDTVAADTPASRAMSLIVAKPTPPFLVNKFTK